MKKLILPLLALLFLTGQSYAQSNFEGTISYKISLLGENAEQMAAFMPESYEYQFSDKDMLFKMKGGMTAAMFGDILVLGEGKTAYMIKHNEKTAYKLVTDTEEEEEPLTVKPVVSKMDETIKIMGYDCQKYKVVISTEDGTVTSYYWVTNQIKITKSKTAGSAAAAVFIDGVEGFPLKVMSEVMGMTMIMTAQKVEAEKLDRFNFKVPNYYEVKDFDPAMFGDR